MNYLNLSSNRLFIAIAMITIFISTNFAQTNYNLDEVVVTAGRTPIYFNNLNRTVNVITAKDIEVSAVNSIPDLLQYISGVDVKQRGTNGVQADVSVRGGTFEQTLVLIDGVKISDPQTGHHNMNLPISFEEIEKIEVLKGEGSQTFGANAISGVINIITKKGNGKSLTASVEGGENGLYNLNLGASYNFDNFENRFSVAKKKSDGYHENTDFDIANFSYRPSIRLKNGVINLLAGYTENKFGANSFYTAAFPNQYEEVKTTLVSGSAELNVGSIQVSPKLYWRKNEDMFLLKRNNPSFYQNNHKTHSYGGEVQASLNDKIGSLSIGAEYGKDEIESSNLGIHNREKYGFFVEQTFSELGKFSATISGFAYKYAEVGWKVWPGVNVGYNLTNKFRAFASFGKAFRLPTFTDLYYHSPSTIGNANLQHEESTNYELGLSYKRFAFDFSISGFIKDGKNLIDYALNPVDEKWYASNINEITTNGIEVTSTFYPSSLNGNFFVDKISLGYTYINADKKDVGTVSRYVLNHLEHQVVLGVFHKLPFEISANWSFRYEQRVEKDGYFLTDLSFNKNIDNVNIFIKGSNIFNTDYYNFSYLYKGEEVGLQLPGRWITAGVKFGI